MTYYLLSTEQPDGPPPAAAELDAIMREVAALEKQMRDAGVLVFNGHLHPPEKATVVRADDGDVRTAKGPYREGSEHVGGISVIDVPDRDAALDWAARMVRATTLPVEVRPFQGD